jgi:hypothetical protein
MTLHLSVLALCMIGGGIIAFVIGGRMVMMFDVSNWMPSAGGLLAGLGAIAVVMGLAIQIVVWGNIS